MANAVDIQGVVYKGGSSTLLARVVGPDAQPIVQADIASAAYTIWLVDADDEETWTAVAGHTAVTVAVADLLFDTLQDDDLWDVDSTGYNFKHVLNVSTAAAFALSGRTYRVVFTLTPEAGQPVLVRFKLDAI